MSMPCSRMQRECASAASWNSFCCSSLEVRRLDLLEMLAAPPSAASISSGVMPSGAISRMPRWPGWGSGMSTPFSRMHFV